MIAVPFIVQEDNHSKWAASGIIQTKFIVLGDSFVLMYIKANPGCSS